MLFDHLLSLFGGHLDVGDLFFARFKYLDDGLEAAARDARLAALATPGRPVLLGHTLDDQAETVLLQLLRGTGPQGLTGIPPVREGIIRPLLDTPRAAIDSAMAANGGNK